LPLSLLQPSIIKKATASFYFLAYFLGGQTLTIKSGGGNEKDEEKEDEEALRTEKKENSI
jgi:hypothetical protein